MAFWSLSKEQPQPAAPAAPAATMDSAMLKEQLGHAYRRGRTDERARRAGRGAVLAGLVLLAAIGAGFLGLGAHAGSFAAAGAQVDQAAAQAMAAVQGSR